MLEAVYQSYRELADTIDWKKYDINDLFRECVANQSDPDLYEKFYSGVMCRVWGYIGRLYIQCNKHVPIEQCYDILINTINYMLKNHVWDNPDNSLYNNPKAPEMVFKVVLKREKGIVLAHLNADKRRSNFNPLSIDEAREEYSDSTDGMLLDIGDLTSEYNATREIILLIEDLFKKGQLLDGAFLDMIAFGSYTKYFDRNIVSCLYNLGRQDFLYYNLVYGVNEKDYNKLIREIHTTSRRLLCIKLNKLLYSLRSDFNV